MDSGASVATVNFDGTDSYPIDPDNSSGLTYLWDVDDGTITSGVATDSTITATFPVGFRHITLTVTDADNSEAHTKRIPIYVYDSSTQPLAVRMNTLEADVQNGWRASFSLPRGSEADIANLPDGAFICYFEQERYGATVASYGSNAPTGRDHIKFVGYLVRDSIRITPEDNEVTFEAIGPLGILQQTGALPQLMISDISPANWQELKSLSVRIAAWYLLFFHTTALEYFDLVMPQIRSTFTFSRLAAEDVSSIAGQTLDITSALNVDLVCDRLGRLLLNENPNYLPLADRSSVTTAYNLTTADILSADIDRDHRRATKTVRGEGITTGADPVFSNAPGDAPGQGTNSETLSRQIVANQSEMNQRTGDHHAYVNGLYYDDGSTNAIELVPRTVRLALPDGYDVFDPAHREFVSLTLASTTNKRGIAFTSSDLWTIESVNIRYDPDRGAKDVEIAIRHETHGPAGVTYIPPQESENGLPPLPDFDLQFPDLDFEFNPNPIDAGLSISTADLYGVNEDGYAYYASDFSTPSGSGGPTWTRFNLSSAYSVSGTPESFVPDAFSPGYTGTVGGAINGWLVTTTNIYRVTDIFGTPGYTSQLTFASGTTNLKHRVIDASFGFENYAIAIASYTDKVEAAYTTDGTNWTEVTVTAFGNTATGISVWPGLFISSKTSGVAYTVGYTSSNNGYVYRTTNSGATWARVTPLINTTSAGASSEGGQASIHAPFENNPNDVDLFVTGWTAGVGGVDGQILHYAKVGQNNGTNITPDTGAAPSWFQRSLSVLGANRNRAAFLTPSFSGATQSELWVSTTGGTNSGAWSLQNSFTSAPVYQSLALVGPAASEVMYLWGSIGAIGYSGDYGVTVDDRRGNITSFSSPTAGRFLNICGNGA